MDEIAERCWWTVAAVLVAAPRGPAGRRGAPPHVVRGMVAEVEVTG